MKHPTSFEIESDIPVPPPAKRGRPPIDEPELMQEVVDAYRQGTTIYAAVTRVLPRAHGSCDASKRKRLTRRLHQRLFELGYEPTPTRS